MSASWMRHNGMMNDSNPTQLARRIEFAPQLGPPTRKEWARAGFQVAKKPVVNLATRLRIKMMSQSYQRILSKKEMDALPRISPQPREERTLGRWTSEYVDALLKRAANHVKTQSKRITQWMLK